MTVQEVVALVLVLGIFGYETWSLATPIPGDEWTGYLRRIRDSGLLGALIVGGGSVWLAYHLAWDVIPGQSWPDALCVIAGWAIVKWRGPVRYRFQKSA